jgi:hypothetical protein
MAYMIEFIHLFKNSEELDWTNKRMSPFYDTHDNR